MRPDDPDLEKATFDGKHGRHSYKIQVAIDFLGRIIMCTGLHLSNISDVMIFEKTWRQHPFEDAIKEMWFGDAVYRDCQCVLAKYAREPGDVLTEEEMFVNNWVNYYRQRVEHIMAVVKKHAAFRQDFRGSHILLRAMVDLPVQMSNCAIKRGWEPVPAMRYPGHDFGPHNAHKQY